MSTQPGEDREKASAERHLVVFGAGYVGGALARSARAAGWRVTALTRNAATAAELRAAGCATLEGELNSDAWWTAPELAGGAARVAVTVAAGGGGVEGYHKSYVDGLRSVVRWGRQAAARGRWAGHLIYTSSTSVYPQGGGARVTEADAVGGPAETTQALIAAEEIARGWPGLPTVLRLAGIYGPGRTFLIEQVRRGEASGYAEAHLNLIARDDIVAACEAVWSQGASASGTFNLADEGEATKGEVVAWLAQRLGVAAPVFSGVPAGGRRAITPDRIIDAARARAVLDWRPKRRSFREGYSEILAGENATA